MIKKIGLTSLFAVLTWVNALSRAQALTISNVSFTPSTLSTESGLVNGTSIGFTIDTPGEVQVNIAGGVQNFGDPGTTVATLTQFYSSGVFPQTESIFWNGLWLIGGDLGRIDGNYQFTLTLSTTGGSFTTPVPASPQVTINSVDIHSVSVAPSLDANGSPVAPYRIQYNLAKQAAVSVSVVNSSNTLVRTVISNKVQFAESISSVTVNWDGLDNSGNPVPIGIYTVQINATDPNNNDHATMRSRQIGVTSLAGAASNPQQLFEQNVFVYPNPVRNGQGTFQFLTIRDGATIFLKIYTLSGTLVFEKEFDNVATGNVISFPWNVTNQAGNKLGRGLYYYVAREQDPAGTLQTIKKMAVLP